MSSYDKNGDDDDYEDGTTDSRSFTRKRPQCIFETLSIEAFMLIIF
jgi:hypothetical protein